MTPPDRRRIILLGATGSIGRQTIDVVARLNDLAARGESPVAFDVVGLGAGRNAPELFRLAETLGVRDLALAEGDPAGAPEGAVLRLGPDGAERLVREVEADVVLGAIVGFRGLPATLAAVELGRDVALANKETLVAAGELVVRACAESGSRLLPVDSEHSGVWQCLAARDRGLDAPPFALGDEVRRVVLTASGGALRDLPADEVERATVEQALAHPTWDMGAKVTIDSASLTNKALELVEAHWLFGLGADRLGALVHPSSTVHALVEYADASVVAQLGAPDMRTPIQVALTYPERLPGPAERLDLATLGSLEFGEPDTERFPALALGFEVIRAGGVAGAVFNAANEAAVEAFLDKRITFGAIGRLVASAVAGVGASPVRSLDDVAEADAEARRCVALELEPRPAGSA